VGHTPPFIIVADDETPIVEMIAELLRDEGYRAEAFTNSVDAFLAISTQLPDLVITDLHMDGPNAGFQVLQMMRWDLRTITIPVIMLSADGDFLRAKRDLLQEHNCVGLEKPVGIQKLLDCVKARLAAPA
jgi:CheY-like chemotaxis protein